MLSFLRLLRIPQYTKNGFVLLPLFFSGQMFHTPSLVRCGAAFVAFCFAASAIYILNDIHDVEEDRRHPVKKNRPIASGEVSPGMAGIFSIFLALLALTTGWLTSSLPCFFVVCGYLTLNLFYIYLGKQKSILDVACIALGFELRAIGGALAISQSLSQWLVLMVFLLCMFLGLGKRWDDLCLTEQTETIGKIRASIDGYSKKFVLSAMTFLSTINTVCYIMYTVALDTQAHYHSEWLYLTSLWVVLGNLRYLPIAFVDQRSTSPTKIMLHDRGIQVCVLCWFVHLTILLYS